jgi:hypothetical protein
LLGEGANGNPKTKHRDLSGTHEELRKKTVGWRNYIEYDDEGPAKSHLRFAKDGARVR